MKLLNKNYIVAALMAVTLSAGIQVYATTATPTAAQVQKPAVAQTVAAAIKADPLELVQNPVKYLNKRIEFDGKFDKFSTLGLDYSRAMRASQDYIGFLVQRPDVKDHNVPFSELKLFLKRDYAEKFIELDTGDKIQASGTVFSNALGDTWIDIDKIVVKEKAKKDETAKK